MKIGIDMRSIQETAVYRGIGKYVVSLIRALDKIDRRNQYYLFLYPKQADFAQSTLPHNERWHFIFLPPSRLRGRKFIRTALPGNEKLDVDHYNVDVLFQLDVLYPIKKHRTPVVSIVHDLIPFIFRDDYQAPIKIERKGPVGLIIYWKKKRLAHIFNHSILRHRQSDKVIAISSHSADDLQRLTGVSPDRIVLVPHGAETIPRDITPTKPKELPDHCDFIFHVGGIDPRKRIPLLVEQFAAIATAYPELYLVLVGKEVTDLEVPQARVLRQTIARLGLEKRVILTGYAADEELAYLYEHAKAFMLPSRYEGFGMQILEAFLAGCPVVAYDNSSIPEVAGDAAMLVEEGQSLMPAMTKILTDGKLRQSLIDKGRQRAAGFTWASTARQTLNVLENVAKETR